MIRPASPATLLAALLCGIASTATAAPPTATLKLLSDYCFRGIDRTEGPAMQGEVDWFDPRGPYIGAWASNNRAAGGAEFDVYAGWSGRTTAFGVLPLRLDGGAIGYLFPGREELRGGARRNTDFVEAYGSAGLGPVKLAVYVSPDYQNAGGASASLRGTLRWPFTLALTGRIEGGWNTGPGVRDDDRDAVKDGRGRDYFDYAVGLGYRLPWSIDAAAEVAGTTLDLSDGHGRDGAQPKFIVSFSRRFDLR